MENLIRLLMRFLLVPLGYLAAAIAATVVVLIAWWQFDAAMSQPVDGPDFAVLGVIIGGPLLLIVMLTYVLLPALIGILISEAFAIRSWIFHVLDGVVFMWVGWQVFGNDGGIGLPLEEPLVVIAAGIAAGFAYWAVAGFSAGFYKPIFRRESPPAVPAATR